MLALFSEHNDYWYKRRLADTVNHQWVHLVCHCMRAQMQSCNVSNITLLHLNGLWLQCWADKTIKGKMWLQKAINFHFSLLEGKQSSAKLLVITWPLGTHERHDSLCTSVILLRINPFTLSDKSLRRINLTKLRVPMILRFEQNGILEMTELIKKFARRFNKI